MILPDTSIWIDHFRSADRRLSALLAAGAVVAHPFVIGELALGHLSPRASVLDALAKLPTARHADEREVLRLIEVHGLAGTGIGYVDVHLLASTMLTPGTALWTRDRRLAALGERLGVAAGD